MTHPVGDSESPGRSPSKRNENGKVMSGTSMRETRSYAHLVGESRDPYIGTPYEDDEDSDEADTVDRSEAESSDCKVPAVPSSPEIGSDTERSLAYETPRSVRSEVDEDYSRTPSPSAVPSDCNTEEQKGAEILMNTENINVTVRFRPISSLEVARGSGLSCTVDKNMGGVMMNLENAKDEGEDISANKRYEFNFDKVFPPETSQSRVFDDIAAPILDGVMNGYNGAILAYGQTGAGKTHTIMGPASDGTSVGDDRGIIPRLMERMFTKAEEAEEEYTIRLSYVECYKEKLNDLLDPEAKIKLLQNSDKKLWVTQATQVLVKSMSDVTKILRTGMHRRKVGATALNKESSRSHAILIATVIKKSVSDYLVKASQLYIVDLAGSERVKKSESTGERLLEGRYINTSLLALGNVIGALAAKKKHVPYRSSILTRLLENSIGGNSRTAIIINCSPSNYNARETLNSLRFGARARTITNKPMQNRVYTLDEYRSLYERTKEELDRTRAYVHTLESEIEFYQGVEEKLIEGNAIDLGREHAWGSIRSSLVCPLTRELLKDPVIAADGFTYERAAISSYLLKNSFKSPTTNEKLLSSILIPNQSIHGLLRMYHNATKPKLEKTGPEASTSKPKNAEGPLAVNNPLDAPLKVTKETCDRKSRLEEAMKALRDHQPLLVGRVSYLELIPEELLEIILSMVDAKGLYSLCQMNRYFCKEASRLLYWEPLPERDFGTDTTQHFVGSLLKGKALYTHIISQTRMTSSRRQMLKENANISSTLSGESLCLLPTNSK